MPIRLNAFDQHIIDIHSHIVADLVLEHLIDEALIDGSYIFQSKRYHFIIIQTFSDDECRLLFVQGSHPDMAISGKSIYEA